MFKRLFWFGSGAVSGAAGSWYVKRRVQQQMQRFTPQGVRQQAVARAKQARADAQTAVAEGRKVVRDYRDRAGTDTSAPPPD